MDELEYLSKRIESFLNTDHAKQKNDETSLLQLKYFDNLAKKTRPISINFSLLVVLRLMNYNLRMKVHH